MEAGPIMVAGVPGAGAALPLAAAIGVESALANGGAAMLVELSPEPRRRPATLLGAPAARELEAYMREAGLAATARGHICHLAVPADDDGLAQLEAARVLAEGAIAVAQVPASLWGAVRERADWRPRAAVLLAELPRDRSLAALVCGELAAIGFEPVSSPAR